MKKRLYNEYVKNCIEVIIYLQQDNPKKNICVTIDHRRNKDFIFRFFEYFINISITPITKLTSFKLRILNKYIFDIALFLLYNYKVKPLNDKQIKYLNRIINFYTKIRGESFCFNNLTISKNVIRNMTDLNIMIDKYRINENTLV